MFNRRAIMNLAWAIYRESLGKPRTSPRKFSWCLSQAWHETKEAARLKAVLAPTLAPRQAALTRELELLTYRDDYRGAEMRRAEITTELARLSA